MDIKINNVNYSELPEIEKYYLDVIRQAVETKMKKYHDYDANGIEREMYYIFGNASLLNELWKKLLRLLSLTNTDEPVECESVEDTLIDIINYSADFCSYLRIKTKSVNRNER
jgi:hypothetical protein